MAQVEKVIYSLMHFHLTIILVISALLRWRILEKGLYPRGFGPTESGSLTALLPVGSPQRPWDKS